MKQNYVTMTKLDEKHVKHVTFMIMKISFLTLFGCGVKMKPGINSIVNSVNIQIGSVLKTPKTYDNHRQTDKQTEIINRVQIEHIRLRRKLVISFNWGKINAIAPK